MNSLKILVFLKTNFVSGVGQWYIACGVWNLFGHIVSTKLTAFSLNVESVFSEFSDFVNRPTYVF